MWCSADLSKYPKIVEVGPKQLKNTVPIVSLNCSGEHATATKPCKLDGVTLTSAVQSEGCPGCKPSPAVRVFSGSVAQLTVMNSQALGGNDCLDSKNLPVGNWVSRSWGGWTMVGEGHPANADLKLATVASDLTASEEHGSPSHALLVGVPGEEHARLAIETSGEILYGDGSADGWQTGVRRHISNSTQWGPGEIAAGDTATKVLLLVGAVPGDIVTAAHGGLDAGNLDISCSARVTEVGSVMIVLRNHGTSAAAVSTGIARVAVVQYV